MDDQPTDDAARRRSDIVAVHDHGPPPTDFGALFMIGMGRTPRSLVGLRLLDRRSPAFRRLCTLPEYYIERAELEILRDQSTVIAAAIGPMSQLIDLGVGASPQIALLLESLDRPWGYVALDRNRDMLLEDARRVQQRHPQLWVEAVRADMRIGFDLPSNAGGGRRVGYLPGNAVGSFDPSDAIAMLALWGRALRPGALLLIGVDLRKSALILESAYDDPHGFNRALILDILLRANRNLGADFDVRQFDYRVHCDLPSGRVSRDLVSMVQQDVHVRGERMHFDQDDVIHVEESRKYSVEDFSSLARGAGYRPLDVWFDARGLFSLHLLEVGP